MFNKFLFFWKYTNIYLYIDFIGPYKMDLLVIFCKGLVAFYP